MEVVNPPPAKKKCFERCPVGKNLVKDVRSFNLTQQFPSRIVKGKSPDNAKSISNSGNTKSVFDNKMHTLKLKSHDGKDLGEFKVTILPGTNSIQVGKTLMISKSRLTKVEGNSCNPDNSQTKNINDADSVTKIQNKDVSSTVPINELQPNYVAKQQPQKENCNKYITIAPKEIKSDNNLFTKQVLSQHRPLILKKKTPELKNVIRTNQTIKPTVIPQSVKIIPMKIAATNNMQSVYLTHKNLNSQEIITQWQSGNTVNKTSNDSQKQTQNQLNNKPLFIKSCSKEVNKNVMITVPRNTLKEVCTTVTENVDSITTFRKNGTFQNKQKETNKISEEKKSESTEVKTRQRDLSRDLNIIEKALSSVSDKDLREKALKALADCGIGIERHVPITPPPDRKSINDSQTQTEVFSILEPDKFIIVNEASEGIERKKAIIKKKYRFDLQQGIHINSKQLMSCGDESFDTEELDKIMDQFLNTNITEVQQTLKKLNIPSKNVLEQWKRDFAMTREYDKDGLLGIHRAILSNDTVQVEKQLIILKMCKLDVDIPMENGKTSLELAVDYDVSSDIVKLLLKANAQPTSANPIHSSALIIASKKSSPHLPLLVKFVSNKQLLNKLDIDGFAPVHYCAKFDNLDGIKALLNAGVDVNLQDAKSGRTPLFHALENRHIEIARCLLNRGAISNIANFAGQTIVSMVDEFKSFTLRAAVQKACR